MKISRDVIQKVKDNISIVEVIQQYVTLHKKGTNWFGPCPFHTEKTASFCVNESKRIFRCFACEVHGDVFSFLMNHNHISYPSAILAAAKFANLNEALINQLKQFNESEQKLLYLYDVNQLAHKYFQMFLSNKNNSHVLDYLYKRGLTDDLIKKFEIGFAPDDQDMMINLLTNKDNMVPGGKQYKLQEIKNAGLASLLDSGEFVSFFRNRVIFPIYDQHHQLVGFSGRSLTSEIEPKYLNTSQTEIFNKNEILYNFDQVVKVGDTYSIYLVEGFMDVIAMYRAGYTNAVATMGIAFSEKHLDQLSRLPELTSIVMAFDNDQAGQQAMAKTANIIAPFYDVYIMQYLSDKYKDLDELVSNDKVLCDKTINNITNYFDFEINQLLSQTKINNILDKNHLLKKLALILSKYRQLEQLHQQVELIAKTLDVNENVILKLLVNSKANYSKTTGSLKTSSKRFKGDQVDLAVNKKNKIKQVEYTENTEVSILECCLLSREAWELFFQKSGKFLYKENEKILAFIDNFYTKNKEAECIMISDLSNTTDDALKSVISNMLIDIKDRKLKYAQSKLFETINTHIQKLYNYQWDETLQKVLTTENNEKRKKYYDYLDFLLKNKPPVSKKG